MRIFLWTSLFLSILLGVASVPLVAVLNASMRLQVMSYYHELDARGIIAKEKLSAIDWEALPGSDTQKAEYFFLRGAPGAYSKVAWAITVVSFVNAASIGLALRKSRNSDR